MAPIKIMKRRDWRHSGVFIVKFEYSSSLSIVNFEHVIDGCTFNLRPVSRGGRYNKIIYKYNISGDRYNRMIHKFNISLTLLLIGYA